MIWGFIARERCHESQSKLRGFFASLRITTVSGLSWSGENGSRVAEYPPFAMRMRRMGHPVFSKPTAKDKSRSLRDDNQKNMQLQLQKQRQKQILRLRRRMTTKKQMQRQRLRRLGLFLHCLPEAQCGSGGVGDDAEPAHVGDFLGFDDDLGT